MHILILGSKGFVGNAFSEKLSNTEHNIIKAHKSDLDLRSEDQTTDYLSKHDFDLIINTAADVGSVHYVTRNCADVLSNNLNISLALYNSIKKLKKKPSIINLISNCCYPGDVGIQKEGEFDLGPVHDSVFAYGYYKRTLIYLSQAFNRQYSINTKNIMLPGIFGPGDSSDPDKVHALNGMIIRMLETAEAKKNEFIVWGSGKPVRDWIYIDDVISATLKIYQDNNNFLIPINISEGKGYTITDSAKNIANAISFKGKITYDKNYQDGAAEKILIPKEFVKKYPNFKFTDHNEAIRNTVIYYKEK